MKNKEILESKNENIFKIIFSNSMFTIHYRANLLLIIFIKYNIVIFIN